MLAIASTNLPLLYLVGGVLVATVLLRFSQKRKLPLPPGPKGYPIVGNLGDLPETGRAQVFADWGKKFGPIVHLSVMGRSMIVLNTYTAAVDLLDKRSAIYSNRPYMPMATLAGMDRGVALRQYSPIHKAMRKKLYNVIGGKNVEVFMPIAEQEVKRYLWKLVNEPDNAVEISRWLLGDIILLITYGYQIAEKDDKMVAHIRLVNSEFAKVTKPGTYLIDVVPLLRYVPSWFPGASFQRTAKKLKESIYQVQDEPFMEARKRMMDGGSSFNFIGLSLGDLQHLDPQEEDILKRVAGATYGAGADTSVSIITSFFLAMALYGDIQAKAQREIDLVVGGVAARLPNFKDKMLLPYTNALIKEVHRWGVVLPTGLPHSVAKEDEYNGYRIPKGAAIIANVWAICQDPEIYPAPEKFNPERHLGPLDKAQLDPTSVTFGFGRRICPGAQLAEQTLFIMIVSILALFDISPVEGEPLLYEHTNTTVSHPKPFKCQIRPRSLQAETLIREAL